MEHEKRRASDHVSQDQHDRHHETFEPITAEAVKIAALEKQVTRLRIERDQLVDRLLRLERAPRV